MRPPRHFSVPMSMTTRGLSQMSVKTLSPQAQKTVDVFMAGLIERTERQPEFHQAVQEVIESLMPFVLEHPEYEKARILDRITEPDRTIIFRVGWVNERGEAQVNRGYRVQFNNAIG